MPDKEKLRKTKMIVATIVAVALTFAVLLFFFSQSATDDPEPTPIATIQPTVTVAVVPPRVLVAGQQLDIVLENPGFEGGFHEQDGIGELKIADGWHAWYIEGQGHHRPEYALELLTVGKGRVYEGAKAQKQATTFAKQDGGIYQRVGGFEPGKWYQFSAYVWIWSSDENNADVSEKNGKYSALVGLNPWGSCWPTHRTTIWGMEEFSYDRWSRISVTAQAWSENLCLFTRGVQEYPVRHGDGYFDAVTIREVAEPGGGETCPTPEPCPTGPPGEGCNYDTIRSIVQEEIEQREPIRWPR